MSVSAVSATTIAAAAQAASRAPRERDQQLLEADLKAQASRAQIAADNTAIANDRLAARASGSTLDTYA